MDRGNNPDADGQFDNALYFNWNGDKVNFDTNWVDNPNSNYGSASGFVPKSLLYNPLNECLPQWRVFI